MCNHFYIFYCCYKKHALLSFENITKHIDVIKKYAVLSIENVMKHVVTMVRSFFI